MKLPQFVPLLTAFTARVAGRELAQLLRSPTALARALADTQTVVGHDGVLCHFDPLILASTCLGEQVCSNGAQGDPFHRITPQDSAGQDSTTEIEVKHA